ncbi:hypothetical protein [Pyrococcus sp. ST04]|uniref:hypothetical protein n=1 Tax=Pyrococcus sp. ST04 TaxID=1183377 RepID=UPI000260586A|nr:hypothetical protein [Pyrococcus sp. ST04]AFK21611.1 hypothetical protein Py04_0003 [Pyrococcus sp. ST04]
MKGKLILIILIIVATLGCIWSSEKTATINENLKATLSITNSPTPSKESAEASYPGLTLEVPKEIADDVVGYIKKLDVQRVSIRVELKENRELLVSGGFDLYVIKPTVQPKNFRIKIEGSPGIVVTPSAILNILVEHEGKLYFGELRVKNVTNESTFEFSVDVKELRSIQDEKLLGTLNINGVMIDVYIKPLENNTAQVYAVYNGEDVGRMLFKYSS